MDEEGKPRKSPGKVSTKAMPPPSTKSSRPQASNLKRSSTASPTSTTPKAATRIPSVASASKLSDNRATAKTSPASPTPGPKLTTLIKRDDLDKSKSIEPEQDHGEERKEPMSAAAILDDVQAQQPQQWSLQDSLTQIDWQELETKYNEKMATIQNHESEIYDKLGRLNRVFEAWATAGQERESERGSKRLRTRIAYVQAHEEKLLKTRNHYVHARTALQQALQTLDTTP